jgi:prepilin-type N-terminal cleavage/methylation domain-containing protein
MGTTPYHRRGGGSPPAAARRRCRGFSLVEALVGLTILALVLTMSLAISYRLPRDLERLGARREADRAAEGILETIRSGYAPLSVGSQQWPLAPSPAPERKLRAWVEVSRTDLPDLYRVAVLVRYLSLGEPRSRTLETLVWRP